MNSSRLRIALATVAVVVALVHLAGPAAAETPTTVPLHPDVAGPVVSIAPTAPVHESLLGGTCYRGDVEADQPAGYEITRTGPVGQPLDVVFKSDAGFTDVIMPGSPQTVTIPAGSATVSVPRLEVGREGAVFPVSWYANLEEDPTYAIDERDAYFDGLAGADPEWGKTPCDIASGERTVELGIGVELPPMPYLWKVRDFNLVGGELPTGMRLEEDFGVAGTPSKAGTWTATIEECPWPAVGDRICGQITYTFTIGIDGRMVGDRWDGPANPTDAEPIGAGSPEPTGAPTAMSDHMQAVAATQEDGPSNPGGTSALARALSVLALAAGLSGLVLVVRWVRA